MHLMTSQCANNNLTRHRELEKYNITVYEFTIEYFILFYSVYIVILITR